jgi:hypothetical protein
MRACSLERCDQCRGRRLYCLRKTVDEWLVPQHAGSDGMVVEVDDARYGRMKQPGMQVTLRRCPMR